MRLSLSLLLALTAPLLGGEEHEQATAKVKDGMASEPAASVLETELKTSLAALQRDLTEWLGEMK